MSVGFIGLGNMGQAMATNLFEKGADLTVFTLEQDRMEAMLDRGVKAATSVADITQKVDIVLACLPNVKTSRALLLGDDGVVANARPGQIIVDHSTVDIATSRACAAGAKEKGAYFLDAPISGGPAGATDGSLSIFVGGNEEAFETAYEYFNKMGENIRFMGPSGAGTAMKLINQLLVGIHTAAAAEAFLLANSAGVDIDTAAELLGVSWGGSTMVERSAPITAKRAFTDSGTPVRTLAKDMGIVKQLAIDEGLALDLAIKSEEMFRNMMEQGNVEHDIAGVLEVIEARSK